MIGSFFRMCFRVFLTGVIIAKNGTGKKDKWVVFGEKGRKRSWADARCTRLPPAQERFLVFSGASSSWTLGWIKDIIRCELHEKVLGAGAGLRIVSSRVESCGLFEDWHGVEG